VRRAAQSTANLAKDHPAVAAGALVGVGMLVGAVAQHALRKPPSLVEVLMKTLTAGLARRGAGPEERSPEAPQERPMRPRASFTLAVLLLGGGCSHVRPGDATVAEHRSEAALHGERAEQELAAYQPGENELRRPPAPPQMNGQGIPDDLMIYNPTQDHLARADQELSERNQQLAAAHALEEFESEACAGLSVAQRSACPLLASSVSRVEDTRDGFRLVMKPTVDAEQTFKQLNCHLAYAMANGFEAPSCPLFVKGTRLTHDRRSVEFRGESSPVAVQLRAEARRIFKGPESAP
jgi:hypothetical protein